MPETTDYKLFKKNVIQPDDRIDRIENSAVYGMPDVNLCIQGTDCWIEQKSPREPKRKNTPLFGSNHKVSQNQKNWFLRQCKAGGRCYFLICTPKRWMLIGGEYADDINKMTISEILERSIWCTNKPVRDKRIWSDLRAFLMM